MLGPRTTTLRGPVLAQKVVIFMAESTLMQKTDNIMKLGITLGQAVAMVLLIISGVTYVHTTFQTKAESSVSNDKIERRIEKIENSFASLADGQSAIKSDVSYIRGRLEPKAKD